MAGENRGWLSGRWLAHMLGRLMVMPSEAMLRQAAKHTAIPVVEKGRLRAIVQVCQASVKVRPLTDRAWKAAIESVAAHPEAAYRMLSGQFGPEVEEAFAAAGADLFPAVSGTGDFHCTCREPNVCVHICALLVSAAATFEENPFLWLEVLGRPRAGLLAAVQARMADKGPARAGAATPIGETPSSDLLTAEAFWETSANPDAVAIRLESATAPDSLLKALGPLPLPPEQAAVNVTVHRLAAREGKSYTVTARESHPADEVLRGYVRYIGEAASALGAGDLPPRFTAEHLPGKALPVAARLAPEVEAVLREEGAVLSLEELAARCPTAASLPDNLGRTALQEMLDQLPGDIAVLAGRYAGPRDAVLAGAVFRHVVSFDEWLDGRITSDADWANALRAVEAPLPGFTWPEGPEVGDELWLTVTDPAGPVLETRLVRRALRQPGLDPRAGAGAQALLRHIAAAGRGAITESDAVAVLLAEGHYAFRSHQDPAWLLPFQVKGLSPDPAGRRFTREPRPWQPALGRHVPIPWPGQEEAMNWFALQMSRRGAPRPDVQAALQTVRWWSSLWGRPQDQAGASPDVGALLEFLWITAPHQGPRHGVDPERVPAVLTAWFKALASWNPDAAEGFTPHFAACAAAEAYEWRLRTRPPEGAADAALLAWIVEGYRWIGAGRCWSVK